MTIDQNTNEVYIYLKTYNNYIFFEKFTPLEK